VIVLVHAGVCDAPCGTASTCPGPPATSCAASGRRRLPAAGVLEQGDLRGAAILNADVWRESDESRQRVVEMQERAFELQMESEAERLEPESIDLSAVKARTLVAVGELDKRDFHEIAERLAAGIAGAQKAVIDQAGHLPAIERPDATASLVRDFLAAP
jgi:3-oxoadipate enol-lactonase